MASKTQTSGSRTKSSIRPADRTTTEPDSVLGRAVSGMGQAEMPHTSAPLDTPGQPACRPPESPEVPHRDELIRRRAYELYEQRGRIDGWDTDDWLAAEAEINRRRIDGMAPVEASVTTA